MRIAQVAPLLESVPPEKYGGTERIVHCLTEALVKEGHDVTLFASGDSRTAADHVAVVRESLRTSKVRRDPNIWHTLQLQQVLQMAERFDIVHFHTDYFHFPVWRFMLTPHVTTLHGRLDMPDLNLIYEEFSEMPVVSISTSQRRPIPKANWVETVYNGTPAENFTFQSQPGDYFAFLGRFSHEKGPEQAIEIAKRMQVPLKMAAKIDPSDREYFAERIEPLLDDPLIEFIGEVGEKEKNQLLGNALATLFPIDWPEPFGLVMTESMACGTPVIAFRNGSVDEVMCDGVTGFTVENVDQAVEAAKQIHTLDRAACRRHFEDHFSVRRMTDSYLKVYQRLIETWPRRPPLNSRTSGTMTTLAMDEAGTETPS